MTLIDQIKFALSRPPRSQIKFIVTTYIDGIISKRFYGKSLVGNFLQLIYVIAVQGDTTDFPASGSPWSNATQAIDTGNIKRSSATYYPFQSNANTGEVTKGLIIGTGTTPVSAADYKIETLIVHGTGSGQMQYQNQTANFGVTIVSLTSSFELQRLFVNASGSQIDVNEIAWYGFGSTYTFMLYRDVLPTSDEIPNGSTYRVTLEISITS